MVIIDIDMIVVENKLSNITGGGSKSISMNKSCICSTPMPTDLVFILTEIFLASKLDLFADWGYYMWI